MCSTRAEKGRKLTHLLRITQPPKAQQPSVCENPTEKALHLREVINRLEFTASVMEAWERELRFRRGLYAAAPGNQALRNIGLGGAEIRETTMEFANDTNAAVQERATGPLYYV